MYQDRGQHHSADEIPAARQVRERWLHFRWRRVDQIEHGEQVGRAIPQRQQRDSCGLVHQDGGLVRQGRRSEMSGS
eukprot:SAG31_NODE_2794_length_5083_cov_2.714687_6_plen_76_part_00